MTPPDFNAAHWIAWVVLTPLIGAMLSFLWPRRASLVGMSTAFVTVGVVVALYRQVLEQGVIRYAVGGWGAPLGIDLYADGLSLLMLLMSALVGVSVSLYALGYFKRDDSNPAGFWPLWLMMWTGLNGLFLAADIFNLYVTLELLGLSAVALVALAGSKNALNGAMQYLLVSLLGSLCYLLGVALLYHAYGTVDIQLLGIAVNHHPVSYVALGLMVGAMVLKSALFPLHFWLPAAHASAPTPVSALLSAVVVKASIYLLLRIWFDVFPGVTQGAALESDSGPDLDLGLLLGLLGAAAVLWGSIQALRQTRLKLLVAYSTVAQLGYLFLPFAMLSAIAWQGGVYFMLSHALAKAAMFMAAGNILKFGGHDRIADLDRIAQRLPITMTAFCLAGVSLMGLPPSGGFIAKWLLLEAALIHGQWFWVVVILVGGLLAAGYIFKVVGYAFTRADVVHDVQPVPLTMEWAALALALAAIALGLFAPYPLALLEVGQPLVGVSP